MKKSLKILCLIPIVLIVIAAETFLIIKFISIGFKEDKAQSVYNSYQNIEIKESKENGSFFNISVRDLINSYNVFYSKEHGTDFLPKISEWYKSSDDIGAYYSFSLDDRIASLPRLTVYPTDDGEHIKFATVSFDWHGYTEELYELYNEICFYLLRVFFPNTPNEVLTELYVNASNLAYSQPSYSSLEQIDGKAPHILYVKNGICAYSYYPIGSSQVFFIKPANDAAINEFRKNGTDIIEIN